MKHKHNWKTAAWVDDARAKLIVDCDCCATAVSVRQEDGTYKIDTKSIRKPKI